jgi:formate hydrogenlyase transcriptional activator
MKPTLLYVDDEPDNLRVVQSTYRHDYSIITAESAMQGLNILNQVPVDVIISDYRMAQVNGIGFLKEVHEGFPDIATILLTAYQDINIATQSINDAHVFGYATKPWKKEELKALIDRGYQSTELKRKNRKLTEELMKSNEELKNVTVELVRLQGKLQLENSYLKSEIEQEFGVEGMIGVNLSNNGTIEQIRQVAQHKTTVLITGETGVGKELIARAIHKFSRRSGKAFVKINCASLPVNLVESELFGYESGAFTGGLSRGKPGLMEVADQGTLFLDEIGELPMEVQAKLLRVLQSGEFFKLGSQKATVTDVRIIAATNRNLTQEIAKGNFRSDLFFRLNVFPIEIPPLRERREDIAPLVSYFVDKYKAKLGISVPPVSKESMDAVMHYHWPGNIRELESLIERSIIINKSDVSLELQLFPSKTQYTEVETASSSKDLSFMDGFVSLEETEKKLIVKVLERVNWKVSGKGGAADILRLNPNTLRSKMLKMGIPLK